MWQSLGGINVRTYNAINKEGQLTNNILNLRINILNLMKDQDRKDLCCFVDEGI